MERVLKMLTWASVAFFLIAATLMAAETYQYKDPGELNSALRTYARDGGQVHELATTPGGRELLLLQLGQKKENSPAVLVIANPDGDCPPASEAALVLCEKLTSEWREDMEKYRWYIIPTANPDGYARFFSKPLSSWTGNDKKINDDQDNAVDEDGPDDLNGDGFITIMRQVHPEGTMIEVEDRPLLLRKAETAKGERGKYRLIVEGIDNDGDGQINEDGSGGVVIGHNFPHEFNHYVPENGLFAASETESQGILKFAFNHPEIAMVIVLGRSNSLKDVPEGGRQGAAMKDTYRLPHWMARHVGVDENEEFTLKELVEMGREVTGNPTLTEEMVIIFLDLGAAVNPNQKDVPYWKEISDKYNDFLKEIGLDGKRLKPAEFSSGSIEEWAYYQFGVPTFSMDFWTLPEPEKKDEGGEKPEGYIAPDSLEKMSNEDFIALGEEKIAQFLKASEAPPHLTAQMVIQGLQGGMMDTKKMAEMMRQGDKEKKSEGGPDELDDAIYSLNPDAFITWQKFAHPTLGEVEIGGRKPFADVLPPDSMVTALIDKQIPFVHQLAGMLPQVKIDKIELKKRSSGVWEVTAWIINKGFLPFPTYQGNRCQRPTPVIAVLNGPKDMKILEGRARQVMRVLDGSGGSGKVVWVVAAPDGSSLNVISQTFSAGVDKKEFNLREGGR